MGQVAVGQEAHQAPLVGLVDLHHQLVDRGTATLQRLTGVVAAFFAGIFPIGLLGELVSIGTMLAFVIVCAGVIVLRYRQPNLARPFRTPMVPLVPILGILICGYMMSSLPGATWERLIVWMVIGLVIYFTYSRSHSRLARAEGSA